MRRKPWSNLIRTHACEEDACDAFEQMVVKGGLPCQDPTLKKPGATFMTFSPANDATHYLYKDKSNPRVRTRESSFYRDTHAERILYIPQVLLDPSQIRIEQLKNGAAPGRRTVFYICEPDPYERFVVVSDAYGPGKYGRDAHWCRRLVFQTAYDADITNREEREKFDALLSRSELIQR